MRATAPTAAEPGGTHNWHMAHASMRVMPSTQTHTHERPPALMRLMQRARKLSLDKALRPMPVRPMQPHAALSRSPARARAHMHTLTRSLTHTQQHRVPRTHPPGIDWQEATRNDTSAALLSSPHVPFACPPRPSHPQLPRSFAVKPFLMFVIHAHARLHAAAAAAVCATHPAPFTPPKVRVHTSLSLLSEGCVHAALAPLAAPLPDAPRSGAACRPP